MWFGLSIFVNYVKLWFGLFINMDAHRLQLSGVSISVVVVYARLSDTWVMLLYDGYVHDCLSFTERNEFGPIS